MDYLDDLICPKCKNSLDHSEHKLVCTGCKEVYEIKEGIPVLVDLNSIDDHLKNQVVYFDKDPVLLNQSYIEYPWQKSYIDRLFEVVPPKDDGNIALDCATGTGYLAIALAKKGYTVYASDLNLNALIRLKKIIETQGLSDKVKLVCCTAEEIPLKANLVNIVSANAILEHLPNDMNSITEFTRIAKSNAIAMITTPLKYDYIFPLFRSLNKYYDKKIGHLRRYDETEYKKKFVGWELVKTYYTGHIPKVFFTIVNKIIPLFSEPFIEKVDRTGEKSPVWASNIISFFKLNDKKILK